MSKKLTTRLTSMALAITVPMAGVSAANAGTNPPSSNQASEANGTIGNDLTPEEKAEAERLLNDPEAISKAREQRPDQGAPNVTTYGLKSWAAKQALKGARWTLEKMGKDRWKSAVKYLGPVGAYITYDKTMDALNIAIDVSGSVTERLKQGFKAVGFNDYLAGVAARAVTFILL